MNGNHVFIKFHRIIRFACSFLLLAKKSAPHKNVAKVWHRKVDVTGTLHIKIHREVVPWILRSLLAGRHNIEWYMQTEIDDVSVWQIKCCRRVDKLYNFSLRMSWMLVGWIVYYPYKLQWYLVIDCCIILAFSTACFCS